MSSRASLLGTPGFRLLLTAHVLANLAEAMIALAMMLLVYDLTGSTLAIAGAAVAMALPQLLVGLPAGVLVDRWNRRRIMVVSDAGRALLVIGFLLVTEASQLWLLFGLAFVQAAIGTLFNPARGALLADLVPAEELLRANSLSETGRVTASVGGVAAAGGLAATTVGLDGVFVAGSAMFIGSAMLVARIRTSPRAPAAVPRRGVWADVVVGLRLITGSRRLVGVIVGASIVMLGLGAVNVLIVPFVIDTLQASEGWFGPLRAAQVVSMILAGSGLALLSGRFRSETLISAGLVGIGLSVAAIGAASAPWHLLALYFLVGWFVTPVQASVTTILQSEVPAASRGRTQATFGAAVAGAGLLSMGVAGAVADLVGVRLVFVACGVAALVAALVAAAIFRSAPPPAHKEIQPWASNDVVAPEPLAPTPVTTHQK